MALEEVLLALYNENAAQARQHELYRQAITGVVGGIAGGIVGVSIKEAHTVLDSPLLPAAGAFLALVGAFGLIATMKHYERNRLHIERMREVRVHLQALPGMPPGILANINTRANGANDANYPLLSKVRLNWIWNTFHLLVVVTGVVMIMLPIMTNVRDRTSVTTGSGTAHPPAGVRL
jgi:hypothetical protein